MKTTIKPYHKDDENACIAAFKSNVPLYFTETEVGDFENFLQRIAIPDHPEKPLKTHYFVIAVNGEIVGCGGFGDKDNTAVITLAWGLVHKEYHKKGLGGQLLSHRLQQIRMLYPDVPVIVDTTQFAYAFFEKYGFCTTKITNDYYETGMHRYDMVLRS